MKKGLTELVFILDRSGSMSGLEQDTIGGYNSMLEKQQKEPGEAIITTVLFDNEYELLHDRINLKGVRLITDKEYFARGSTALLDAIGRTVDKIKNVQKNTAENELAENVMFVIITDGMENSSREYSHEKIKAMIEEQKEKDGWEFIFIGANIDAIATADKFGIAPDRAVDYHADAQGVQAVYHSVEAVVGAVRKTGAVIPEWKAKLEKVYKNRKK